MMKSCIVAVLVSAVAGTAFGQTDRLYITDTRGGTGNIYVVQAGSLANTFSMAGGGTREGPIAVASDVRTISDDTGTPGAQYTLGGAWTGTTYATNPTPGQWFDGTTDGKYNYSCAWPSDAVYRFDRDWQNPTLLFSTGRDGEMGITWDSKTNTLWTGNHLNGTIENYSMNGSLLTEFSLPYGPDGVAYEPSTDTIWLESYNSHELHQYDKAGLLLQSFQVSGMPLSFGFDAEFAVPAPGAAALLGLGGLIAGRRRRA